MSRGKMSGRGGPYHHGDLAAALVAAAERVLEERGVEGFTLRECARRAGVSHAAPAHHFGDVRGLLTEVAASGFERLTQAITTAVSRERDADKRLLAGHLAYVRFALAHSALFRLMFHSCHVNRATARIGPAGDAAFATLRHAVADVRGRPFQQIRAAEAWRDPGLLGQWSLVHGLATLAMEGQFGPNPTRKSLITAIRAALNLSVATLRARRKN
jgi:AcrR family transcriptional regulator